MKKLSKKGAVTAEDEETERWIDGRLSRMPCPGIWTGTVMVQPAQWICTKSSKREKIIVNQQSDAAKHAPSPKSGHVFITLQIDNNIFLKIEKNEE